MKISILPAASTDNASARLRAFDLCNALVAVGQEAAIEVLADADVLVVQKAINDDILHYAKLIKDRGGVVIYDLDESSATVLDRLQISANQWQDMVALADVVTTDTPARRDLLLQSFPNAKLRVLPSGIDYLPATSPLPARQEGERLQVLWFGYVDNLHQIAPYMDVLNAMELDLHVATDAQATAELEALLPGANIIPWNLTSFPDQLRTCDLALLLQQGDEHVRARSNQKMLACIANGVVPIVSDSPEYSALAGEIGAGDSAFSTPEEMATAIGRYASLQARTAYLEKARPLVLKRYAPEAVAQMFLDIVTSVSPDQTSRSQVAPANRGAVQTAGPTSAAEAGDESPLFTVILTTHNRPRLLVDALRSVDNQTCRDFEIILVNDCGEPVEHLLNQFGSVIHLVRQGRNRGPSAARNTGLTLARGKYVVYLDDDDRMLPNHLEVLARELAAHPGTVVYTDPEYVSETLEAHRRIEHERGNPCAHDDFSAETLAVQNFIPINTFCHPLAIIRQTGKWDESLSALEDWEFLLRLAKVMPFRHIKQTTVEVRVLLDSPGSSITTRGRRKFPELFRKIYAQHPTDNSAIQAGRKKMLAMLDAERKAREAETGEKDSPEKSEETAAERQLRFYRSWIERHTLQEVDAELVAERMLKKWTRRPQFLVLALYPRSSGPISLHRTLQSLQSQLYQDWRLVIIADSPSPDPVFEQTDTLGWLHLDSLDDDATVFTAINQVIATVSSDWVSVLPAGTEFAPNWMISTADYINLHPEWAAIYTDDDCLDKEGLRCCPRLKPDFNLDYLRSMDYVGNSCWFRTDHVQELGGFGTFPGALHYELLLRLFDTCGHQVIGHIAEPLVHYHESPPTHPLADAAIQVALEAHFQRAGIEAAIEPGYAPGTRHIVYQHDTEPLVSIVIPNRDSYGFLKPCVESIFAKTDYPAFEVIIVDNQTTDPDVLAFYVETTDRYAGRLRVVPYDKPFNFSAQCNLGVEAAKGEYILLLNNDTEIVQPAWLSRMMQFGQRPDVGIVGARLVYPEDGGVQHAGVIAGLGPVVAAHPYQGSPLEEPGYMNRLHVDQNYSAVTAACLLARRSVYQDVGGMDEENLEILFNDLDLCFKAGEAGYRVVWTPHATVVHLEHKSLEIDLKKQETAQSITTRNWKAVHYMHSRWQQMLANDPAYNRHLTLTGTDFSVDPVLVADWDTNFHDRPRVLAFPPPGGVGEYRFYAPLRGLSMAARIQSTVVQTAKYHQTRYPTLTELNRLNPDTLMRQASYDALDLEWLTLYRRHRPDILYVSMMDDLITAMPKDHPYYRVVPRDARFRLRQMFAQVDRLIVSTEPLRDFAKDMVADVRVLPNRLRDDLWRPLSSQRRTSKRPRIGWAGAQQHGGDLALIVDIVKQTAEEADWIFFGMCPNELRPYVREYHEFEVGVEAYPAKLASLNLDLAVAPLESHSFNEAKSNLRILEYGVLGFPVICTDILPYQTDNAPVKRVANDGKAWLEAIRERIYDLDAAAREGDALKEWVLNNYMLSQHLDTWYQALTEHRS